MTKHRSNGHVLNVPDNREAERAFIGSVLLLPEALDLPEVVAVQPSEILDPHYAIIFRHVREAHDEGREFASIFASMTARGEYSPEIRQAVVDANNAVVNGSGAKYYAEKIRDAAEHRSLWQLQHQLQRQIDDRFPPADVWDFLEHRISGRRKAPSGGPRTMADRIKQNRQLRAIVINGMARVGEVVNVVAPSKRGKSWLVLLLAFCVVLGKRLWDTFACTPGRVLIIDNELHEETSDYRIKAVANAMGLKDEQWADDLLVENVRGRNFDIHAVADYLAQFKPGQFAVIVLDALYRFYPKGFDENSNADMTWLYNLLDGIATRLQCAIVCIIHSSKGSQADKSLVDVGSGAGAMSRAADCHAAIREHEEPGCVVFDYAPRSFPPADPICLRWAWPLWTLDGNLDPAKLFRAGKKGKDKPIETVWTAESFAATFGRPEPTPVALIVAEACEAGLSSRKANELVKQADALGKLHRWLQADGRALVYATVPQPDDQNPQPAPVAKQRGKAGK